MKLPILLALLLCAAFASAQYVSEGWKPGQQQRLDLTNDPPPHDPSPAQTFHRTAEEPPSTAPPVASLFERMGVEFTEAIAPNADSTWDPRIPLITDENFDEVITREALTPDEEAERVWFLIISIPEGQNSANSKLVDQSFDEAYDQTLAASDLPHVRWGRINYANATFLTTKWSIWSGPYLVVATDRGQTLRFFKADRARVTPEMLRELLTGELWRYNQPWKTDFAPGGSREWILHYCALGLMHTSNFANRFPRWALLVGSGTLAILAMRVRRGGAPSTTAMVEHRLQPTDDGGTAESSCAVATSKALFGSTATSTATASPSRGATTTMMKEPEKTAAVRKLKK
ncbi:hypothetical protein TRAPUB_907 [Trametes pubescens]|uniref:Thioredoxin domain-containing protein n=1 Tax=Trametes pubescens TaxID=154538 RepID=A0A1M2VKQ8_TRAPU|nr:hypothetical protein TRAPUB_907 [Trametes pubescens]